MVGNYAIAAVSSFAIEAAELKLPSEWVLSSPQDGVKLQLCKIVGRSSLDASRPPISTITHSITINQDMAWLLVVHGKLIDCSTLPGFSPKISNSTTLNLLLQTVNDMNVCVGHPEEQYVALLELKVVPD